jgi:WD40 repeat protein/predicted Ser/Thr protein kinase
MALEYSARPLGNDEGLEELETVAGPGPGRILGERYQIREVLGRGGMGEVYRAFDLKLRVDVALKAVRPELLQSEKARELLRQEVRSAREVVSPNVCRIFDLVVEEGRELVSMEYIDGTTLSEALRRRGPRELREAREIAAQFLSGLEAIHQAGLVHRDFKPENVMLTRAGRVVVMDFGLAKPRSEGTSGTIAGTPAYMAPEQARGEPVDARADVFSAGIVLAEMLSVGGEGALRARQALWEAVRQEPPQVPEGPWAPVLRQALSSERERRHATARALAHALDEVTHRLPGFEDKHPYPGLASFTAEDAEYFCGRELEVEAVWKKLKRPRLLALIGPSGAGKSSFLRAGLLPTLPPAWRAVLSTPGNRPFQSLAQALVPAFSGDTRAMQALLRFEDPETAASLLSKWRQKSEHGLVIVDQFEELFTLNPPEVQGAFATLLGRLVLEADVHVLLSLRDDFLFHCQAHDALSPVFSDLTPLGTLSESALRRVLVQPALACGYRFEDEALVEEMVSEVSRERGVLPLLAFAAWRLWEKRDREKGLLTRKAYREIGGVAGALAQHAEATIETIGAQRQPLVRELFRNLVAAQGTRASREVGELLSIFPTENERRAAEEVLQQLVAARLLTSYEPEKENERSERRIEIIHESLLSAWPRLVRWLAQDQEGALLRDQLRQAARLWEERGRPEDLLWTGTSFREYELWRERYTGHLTASEEGFARTMTARAVRRRRQRRLAVAAVVAAALAVASGMSVLWRRSETARSQAVAAARHAEAQQTFALGQLELEKEPTAALAYALSSLEHADTPHARLLALRALWRGPIAMAVGATDQQGPSIQLAFSPDGRWLADVEQSTGTLRLWNQDGGGPRVFPSSGGRPWLGFSADSRFMVVTQPEAARIYSLPGGELIRRVDESFRWGFVGGQELITGHLLEPAADGRWRRLVKTGRLPDGEPETLGVWTSPPNSGFAVDPTRERGFSQHREGLYELPLREIDRATPRAVVRSQEPIEGWFVAPDGERSYTWGDAGAGRIWSRATGARLPGPQTDKPADAAWWQLAASLIGRWLAAATGGAGAVLLWDLAGPVAAEPRALRRDARVLVGAFDAASSWLAARDNRALTLWPVGWHHPHVLRAPEKALWALAIDPGGRWIAARGLPDARAWLWPLGPDNGAEPRALDTGAPGAALAMSPRGDVMAAGTSRGAWLVPLGGGPPEHLEGFEGIVRDLAFDPEGRRLAAGGVGNPWPREKVIRVWDLATRRADVLDPGDGETISGVAFLPDGRLLSVGGAGLRLWDVAAKRSTLVLEGAGVVRPSRDGRRLLCLRGVQGPEGAVGTALVHDIETKETRTLATHGNQVICMAWGGGERFVVTGSRDGIVRVGPETGEEPHLLFGHEATVRDVAVDPEGRWIASTGEDRTVRLWPQVRRAYLRRSATARRGPRDLSPAPDGHRSARGVEATLAEAFRLAAAALRV